MDPKSKLYNTPVPLTVLIAAIDDYTSRHSRFYWNCTPEELKTALRSASQGRDHLDYGIAQFILRQAETQKMIGGANKGLDWIREQWKAHAKRST